MVTINCNHHPLLSRMHKPEVDEHGAALPMEQQDKRAVVPLLPAAWDAWLHGTPTEAAAVLTLPPEDAFATEIEGQAVPPPEMRGSEPAVGQGELPL